MNDLILEPQSHITTVACLTPTFTCTCTHPHPQTSSCPPPTNADRPSSKFIGKKIGVFAVECRPWGTAMTVVCTTVELHGPIILPENSVAGTGSPSCWSSHKQTSGGGHQARSSHSSLNIPSASVCTIQNDIRSTSTMDRIKHCPNPNSIQTLNPKP